MSLDLIRSFVWTDFRLAVLFTVIVPLILLVWAFAQKADAIQRLLVIYWRVASLLAITVYLMIGSLPISFLTGFCARLLIPLGLWFWVDLNEELDDQFQTPLKLTFSAWRWAVSAYSVVGAIASIPFLPCSFSQTRFADQFCQVWLDPPFGYKAFFHANTRPQFLGFLAIIALVIYLLYLVYFVVFRLAKQGRSAIEQ
ncbi:MAG: DUF3177 family protein [Oculatellaceae cyanobacterium Prado106]|jgi:hypothetical protein|nr:DUF3177 family protein [Oculatellaceae cyanobacterium Prado106]